MPESSQELKAFPGISGVQVVETKVRDVPIESVVIYQDRAEVRRLVPVHLCAGENEIIVYGLADCIDKNSIRVEGTGNAVITDVIYSSKTTSDMEQPTTGTKEEYERMKSEIEEVKNDLKQLEYRREVLEEEKKLLTTFADHVSNIHSVKGDENSLSQLMDQGNVSVVMELFERVETKLCDIDSRHNSVQREYEVLSEKLAVLKANAAMIDPTLQIFAAETLRSIHVGLETAAEGDATLAVSYVVENASWSSAYDIRVFTKDKTMKVQYYGLIKQQTGEDWDKANVSLSTAQPSIGGSAPSLPARIIRFKRPKPVYPYALGSRMQSHFMDEYDPTIEDSYRGGMDCLALEENSPYPGEMNQLCLKSSGLVGGQERFRSVSKSKIIAGKRRERSVSPPPALDVEVAKVTAGLFNTTYAIPRATTIPADNTEHKVTVAMIDLSPEFTYSSVPRLSPYSFLQAKARNTSPYTVLAGPANVFLDNNFIAKSELSDVSPNEEFTTSLGADQSIRITCQPVATVNNTRTAMLGGAKTKYVTYTHSFAVKNTRSDSVNIKVLEQVPLSTDDRIKVSVTQPDMRKAGVVCPLPFGHALLNESNNVEWHTGVEPGSELELKLVYTVEHPAEDGVDGLPK